MSYLEEFYSTAREDGEEYFPKGRLQTLLDHTRSPYTFSERRKELFDAVDKADPEGIISGYYDVTWTSRWLNECVDGTAHPSLHSTIIDFVRDNSNDMSVVEYGCGSGDLVVRALDAGAREVTAMDVAGEYFRFSEWRSQKREWPIQFIEICDDLPEFGTDPDIVISNEVAEHCNNPIKMIWNIARQVKEGTVLYLSSFFNDCFGADPSHLEWNNVFQDVPIWFEILRKLGFDVLARDENGAEKVFRKNRPIQYGIASRFGGIQIWKDDDDVSHT